MLTGSPDSKPVCAKLKYWMIEDLFISIGNLQISLLMEAYAANKTIWVGGTATCTVVPDGEDATRLKCITAFDLLAKPRYKRLKRKKTYFICTSVDRFTSPAYAGYYTLPFYFIH